MVYIRGCFVSIKDTADDFYEAYNRCFEAKENTVLGIKDETQIVSIPGFVNGFFACELYIKFLLGDRVNKINRKNSHNIKILYHSLDKKYKNSLKQVKPYPNYTIGELLNKIGNGYIAWRYVFEGKYISFGNKEPL